MSRMTAENFEAAAAIARSTTSGYRRDAVVDAFVALFRPSNARFDEARFRAACDPTPAKEKTKAEAKAETPTREAPAASGPYVLRNVYTGKYVAPSGSARSFTGFVENARHFATLAEAKRDACDDEQPHLLTDLPRRESA